MYATDPPKHAHAYIHITQISAWSHTPTTDSVAAATGSVPPVPVITTYLVPDAAEVFWLGQVGLPDLHFTQILFSVVNLGVELLEPGGVVLLHRPEEAGVRRPAQLLTHVLIQGRHVCRRRAGDDGTVRQSRPAGTGTGADRVNTNST